MPGARLRSSDQAPFRNTQPPTANTATPKTAGMYSLPGKRGPERPRMSCSPVEKTRVGIVSARLHQKRRRYWAGSWALWPPECATGWSWPMAAWSMDE